MVPTSLRNSNGWAGCDPLPLAHCALALLSRSVTTVAASSSSPQSGSQAGSPLSLYDLIASSFSERRCDRVRARGLPNSLAHLGGPTDGVGDMRRFFFRGGGPSGRGGFSTLLRTRSQSYSTTRERGPATDTLLAVKPRPIERERAFDLARLGGRCGLRSRMAAANAAAILRSVSETATAGVRERFLFRLPSFSAAFFFRPIVQLGAYYYSRLT
jgi:hypothetical protein